MSPTSDEFLSVGSLTDQEYEDIDTKFADISYFDETFVDEYEEFKNIGGSRGAMVDYILGGDKSNAANTLATKPVYSQDLPGLTKRDFEEDVAREIDKIQNPHKYDLTDEEVEELNLIRNEIFSGDPDSVLNKTQDFAKNRLLEKYKSRYTDNIIQDKVNNYIRSNSKYFTTRAKLVKEKTATYNEDGSLKTEGVDINAFAFADRGQGGLGASIGSNVKTDNKDIRLSDQSIIFTDIDKFQEVSKKISDEYDKNEELKKEILNYKERASKPDFEFDAEESVAMRRNVSLYNANRKALLKVIPTITAQNKNIKVLLNSTNLLEKNYDLIEKNLAQIALGFGDIGLGIGRVASFFSPSNLLYNEERVEYMDNLALEWDNYKVGVKNSYRPDIKFADAFKDGNFGEFAAQEVSTQIPIFTTMIASGGLTGLAARGIGIAKNLATIEALGAGAFIGTSSGGQNYNTMTAEEMRDPFVNYSEAEKFLVSAGYGAAEGLFGTAPSYYMLRNTANMLTRSGKNAMAREGFKRYFAKNIAFPMVTEPLSEGLTSMTQNMLLDRPLMENVDHAMFSGLMFSVVMNASPALAGRMMQDFSSITDMKEFNKINSEMNAIDKALNRKNSMFKRNSTEWRSMRNNYRQLQMDRDAIVNDLYNNITTKVSKRSFKQFMDNTSAQSEIRLRAQKIINDGGLFLGKEQAAVLNALQKDFDQLQFSRDMFKSQENFGNEFSNLLGQDSQLYDLYIKKAKQNLKADGVNDPSSVKTFQEASSLYFQDQFQSFTTNVKKNKLSNIKVFENNQELINFIDSDPARKAEFDKKNKRWIIENGKLVLKNDTYRNAVLRGDINGANIVVNGKKFEVISKENSLNNERAGTGYHEFSHSVLFEALAASPEQYSSIAKNIIDYVKETDTKLYNTMFKSGGGQQADILSPEEVVVNFLERVGEEKVKDPKFIGVISESLSKTSGLDINFRSEMDTIKFLYDLGMKIKNGTLSKADLRGIRLNLREKLDKADYEVSKIDITQFSDSDANIIQTLYNNLGAAGVEQIAENKYIKKILNEVSSKYKLVPGYNVYKKEFEDGLINDPVYGILGSLLTYDSKKNPVLVSHVIARLRQRSKTLAEKIFPQYFSGDADNQKYDETDPEILNQRESLRISLGLTPEVISKIKESVLKTFRGKLPNVTSTDFKNKLKESFRIYLKKTIAKDVLGKGEGYNKFLETNFELIYQVLSQNTINKRFKPFAERVLGEEGKQLREKTAQGNDVFIKRKITKEEFVNYFLGEDVGRSTQGTRKTALAEGLAEEIAFDATLDVLRDTTPIDSDGNTLLDRVEKIIEINGEQFSENYLSQVAKEIDRATDFKFSDSSAGITVLDFDDTVAISKSKVIVNMPDKTKKEITPAEFAKQHDALKSTGAEFDFSQFNKVIGGEKGPLFSKLQKAVNKFGNKNVYILTARPQASAPAIKAWLKSQGIALSESNIVGLEDGSAQAKADWILGKAEEGFNNFYFADDVLENTYAVEQVLSQVDVKYKINSQFSSSAANFKKLIESASNNLATFDDFFQALIKGQQKYNVNISKRKGQVLEYYVSQELKGIFGDNIKILNIEQLKSLKTGDTGVDVKIQIGDKKIGIEVKTKVTDRMGSKSGYKGIMQEFGSDVASQAVGAQMEINDKIIKALDKLGIEYTIDKKDNSIITPRYINNKEIVEVLAENGVEFSDTQMDINIESTKAIVDLYEKKGADYIYFGDKGLFSLGNNPLNLDVRSLLDLILDTKLQVTVKTSKRKKNAPKDKQQRRFFIRAYLGMAKKGTIDIISKNDINPSTQINESFATMLSDSNVNLDNGINNIIEKSSGIKNIVRYSDTKARMLGKDKGKGGFLFRFSADDLKGFTYEIAKGIKGKEGDAALQFFKENLHRPYDAGMQAINFEQIKLMDDFKSLKNKLKTVPKILGKKIKGDVYTNGQAVRIYIWKKQGMDIPGIPKQDIADMVNHVKSNLNLLEFADGLAKINGVDGYPAPILNWEASNIEMDMYEGLNTSKRAKHLKSWQQNVDIIFSQKNLNKMEVAYGADFVKNIKGMLERMRTGKNKKPGGSEIINKWNEWINGSVGTIMFYNMRSAILQTISMANYINWHDNNMLAASRAFSDQSQYWKDFLYIFNSDYLKVRRGGLQLNINENELADQANKKGVKGVIALILKNGFTPTRIADSLAISTGGATMYRNRIKTYIKDGLSQADAEAKAFEDFMDITEESQQSSRPDKISAQQASSAGRILLAFANTPMQYNRMIKRAGQDLYYGRGNWKTNTSKIIYYSTIQNFIFNALQKGLYALGFGLDEDDPEKQKEKTTSVMEGMADSLLRGVGIQGQIALTAKAFLKDMAKERRGFTEKNWDNILELSPPIGSKIRKMMSADYLLKKYDNSVQAGATDIRNPYLMAYAQYASALFNIPLDRALRKAHNVQSALASDTEGWQSTALLLGWNEWDIGIDGMERELGKTPIKTEEYTRERNETKEDHQRKIDSIVNLGYTRIPLSGKKSFEPEGKLGVDYLRLKRKIDGKYQYFVTKEVFDAKFPPPPPKVKRKKTKQEIIQEARDRINKLRNQ